MSARVTGYYSVCFMERKEGGNKIEREKEGGEGGPVAPNRCGRTLCKLHEVSFVILIKTSATSNPCQYSHLQ